MGNRGAKQDLPSGAIVLPAKFRFAVERCSELGDGMTSRAGESYPVKFMCLLIENEFRVADIKFQQTLHPLPLL